MVFLLVLWGHIRAFGRRMGQEEVSLEQYQVQFPAAW
jgi:hypothetical protein